MGTDVPQRRGAIIQALPKGTLLDGLLHSLPAPPPRKQGEHILTVLDQAESDNQPVDRQQAQQLINQGNALLQQVNKLAASA